MSHAPIGRRDPFGSSAAWTLRWPFRWMDAPDVQFIWERTLNEVNECLVRRPQREVTVDPGRRGKNGVSVRSAVTAGHEQWVSGARRMVCESGAVLCPVELGHPFKVGLRLPAQRWHCPDTDVAPAGAVLLANPKRNERAVGRESQGTDRKSVV